MRCCKGQNDRERTPAPRRRRSDVASTSASDTKSARTTEEIISSIRRNRAKRTGRTCSTELEENEQDGRDEDRRISLLSESGRCSQERQDVETVAACLLNAGNCPGQGDLLRVGGAGPRRRPRAVLGCGSAVRMGLRARRVLDGRHHRLCLWFCAPAQEDGRGQAARSDGDRDVTNFLGRSLAELDEEGES